ncbi:hypothetical protein EMPS_03336 [Entomortierella parvispora]|uniref:Uncharacterized protein n=1 Tax=Entomortierella parvispora TaxID=205924 RepID=A0A9P3H6G6_9FUNG|nr:hypothetical protein EMPS_03336 [Entomortierella parvispora]
MVTATPATTSAGSFEGSVRVKAPVPKAGFKSSLIRSQGIILDLDAIPPPTSPLPIPNIAAVSTSLPSTSTLLPPASPSPSLRTTPRMTSHDKLPKPLAGPAVSLRPPPRQPPSPRPRSIVSHIGLSSPPEKSLPPVPSLLHTHDTFHGSTPTSPTSPTSPISPISSMFSTPSTPRSQKIFSTSLPTTAMRSLSLGRVPIRTSRRGVHNTSESKEGSLSRVDRTRGPRATDQRLNNPAVEQPGQQRAQGRDSAIADTGNGSETAKGTSDTTSSDVPRPLGLVATQYYGIESSMRWREGLDPIQKRFPSSNGSWRCQDRFAVFFRPGDQLGPDQVVTKTFWSEAWPYPIETILYGTVGAERSPDSTVASASTLPSGTRDRGGSTSSYSSSVYSSGHSSDHEGDRQATRGRAGGPRLVSSESQLKTAASFPSSTAKNDNGQSTHPHRHHNDPRYITSDGVQKIAKVVIPMPDIAIDQMDVVKAPIKVELRIFILESPLRIHATALLLGRMVAGSTELYI